MTIAALSVTDFAFASGDIPEFSQSNRSLNRKDQCGVSVGVYKQKIIFRIKKNDSRIKSLNLMKNRKKKLENRNSLKRHYFLPINPQFDLPMGKSRILETIRRSPIFAP